MALGELGAVGAVDQRHMREHRRLPTQRAIEPGLTESVVEMIVAANDVGDFHVVVVDHHRKHVGGRAVGAQQHHVVELGVVHRHLPLHRIRDHRLAVERRLEADHWIAPRRRLGWVAVAPAPVIKAGAPGGERLHAHRLELLGRAPAAIGEALGKQLRGDLGVTRRARELVHRLAVPEELEPAQAVEDRLHRRLGRPRAVGVLDAQDEPAAVMAGIEPVEQRRAGAADVEESGGRGGETGYHCHGQGV